MFLSPPGGYAESAVANTVSDEATAEHADSSGANTKWATISTLTAIGGLVVALVFNSVQVANNAAETKHSRETTEVQLFTQLNGLVTRSVGQINSQGGLSLEGLTPRQEANFQEALTNFEYLAWLFNNQFITIQAARTYWLNPMRCAYDAAAGLFPPRQLKTDYPNLIKYVRDAAPCR